MQDLANHLPPGTARFVRAMVRIKLTLGAVATILLPLTFTLVVIMRYLLHADLFAYEEWLLPLAFWLYFLGGAVGSYQNAHIRADLLESVFRSRRLRWTRQVTVAVIELAIVLVLTWWAWQSVASDIAAYPRWQTTIALKIPFLVPHLATLVGFVFIAFYTALHLYVLLRFGSAILPETPGEETRPEGAF